MTRSMLLEPKAPKHFWPEAIATSAYLLNRLPTSILKHQTPLQVLSSLTNIPPPLTLEPRVFGCSVFVHIPKHERTKLSPCAIKCVFVGYGVNQKGYRCFDPKSNRMFTTMNCNFLETEYFFAHLSGQGESNTQDNSDTNPLSWISIPMPTPSYLEADPTEEAVRSTAEQVSDVVESDVEGDIIPVTSPTRLSNVSTHVNSDNCLTNCSEEMENSTGEMQTGKLKKSKVLILTQGDTYFHQDQTGEFHQRGTHPRRLTGKHAIPL